MERCVMFLIGSFKIVKMSLLPKVIYKFSTIPIIVPA